MNVKIDSMIAKVLSTYNKARIVLDWCKSDKKKSV